MLRHTYNDDLFEGGTLCVDLVRKDSIFLEFVLKQAGPICRHSPILLHTCPTKLSSERPFLANTNNREFLREHLMLDP